MDDTDTKPQFSARYGCHVAVFITGVVDIDAEQESEHHETMLQGELKHFNVRADAMVITTTPMNEAINNALRNFAAQVVTERGLIHLKEEGRASKTETIPVQDVPGGAKA